MIILVGIPGSGKSTVLQTIKDKYPLVSIVNYGEMMLQEASQLGIERDTLRKLPVAKQQEMGSVVAEKIAKASQGITIVDTHACIRTPVGYCPGVPLKIFTALAPKAFVLVQCSPTTIIQRRSLDPLRKRDQEDPQELALHQELTRSYLVAASSHTGGILCIVNNDGPSLNDNINPLAKLIESMT